MEEFKRPYEYKISKSICMECKWDLAKFYLDHRGNPIKDGYGLCQFCREKLIRRPMYASNPKLHKVFEELEASILFVF